MKKNLIALSVLVLYAASLASVDSKPPTKHHIVATTTTTLLPPTTTTVPPTTTAVRGYRNKTPKVLLTPETTSPEPSEGTKKLSTAYCLTGTMASGKTVYLNAVASNEHRLGTKLYSPDLDRHFVVEDRHSKRLSPRIDIWMPSCDAAIQWGKRYITIIVEN